MKPNGSYYTHKICKHCGMSKPIYQYGRTPAGRWQRTCLRCAEDAKRQAAKEKSERAAARRARPRAANKRERHLAARAKWEAYAMGDEQAVDWGAKP